MSIAAGADLLGHLLVDRHTGAGLPGHILAVLLGDLVAVLPGNLVAVLLRHLMAVLLGDLVARLVNLYEMCKQFSVELTFAP